jgi:hypothetical protein
MHTAKVSESPAVDRTMSAREQSALFPARLALARWTSGSEQPLLPSNVGRTPRAAWYAEAQRNFQAWLERGGFTQHDHEPEDDRSSERPSEPDGRTTHPTASLNSPIPTL